MYTELPKYSNVCDIYFILYNIIVFIIKLILTKYIPNLIIIVCCFVVKTNYNKIRINENYILFYNTWVYCTRMTYTYFNIIYYQFR